MIRVDADGNPVSCMATRGRGMHSGETLAPRLREVRREKSIEAVGILI